MKNMFLLLCAVLTSTATGNATTGVMSVAVLELDAHGITCDAARVLTDRLRSELVSIDKYEIMEREQMHAVLQEKKLPQRGLVAHKSIIDVGKMMSVQGLITGSIGMLGEKFMVIVQLVDVETGLILGRVAHEYRCELEALSYKMQDVALQLLCVDKRAEFTLQYYDKEHQKSGNFYIKSYPSGATVYLNNKIIRDAVTPFVVEHLPVGTYTIRVEKGDFSLSKTMYLEADAHRKVKLKLKKKKGPIAVASTVSKSDVYLNNVFVGVTPLSLAPIEVGEYRVTVKKVGYIAYSENVVLRGDDLVHVNAVLAKPGFVKILSVPLGAEVFVDGKKRGVTPLILSDLNLDKHVLEMYKPGYVTYKKKFVITTSHENKLEPTLIPFARRMRVSALMHETIAGEEGTFDTALRLITMSGSVVFATALFMAVTQ